MSRVARAPGEDRGKSRQRVYYASGIAGVSYGTRLLSSIGGNPEIGGRKCGWLTWVSGREIGQRGEREWWRDLFEDRLTRMEIDERSITLSSVTRTSALRRGYSHSQYMKDLFFPKQAITDK